MREEIKEIEEEIGEKLIERKGRRMKMMKEGEEFMESERDIVEIIEELKENESKEERKIKKRMRMGVIN